MWWFPKLFKKKEEKKTDIEVLIKYHKFIDEIEEKQYNKSPDYITRDILKTKNHEITINYNVVPIYGFGSHKCYGINYMDVEVYIDNKIYISFKNRFTYKDFFINNEIKLSERLLQCLDDTDKFECYNNEEVDKQKIINILKDINGEKILEHNYNTRKFYGMEPINMLRRNKNGRI